MRFGEEEVQRSKYLKIDLEGKDSDIWQKCKSDLLRMISKIMESQVNASTGSTVSEELKRVGSNAIEYANAKLQKPTIENEKLLAEIDFLLQNSAKSSAETRKLNAEAEAIELQNIEKKFKIVLGAAKMVAVMENNQEGLLFCKNIEGLVRQFGSQNLLKNN